MVNCYVGEVYRAGKERVTGHWVFLVKIETGSADFFRNISLLPITMCGM